MHALYQIQVQVEWVVTAPLGCDAEEEYEEEEEEKAERVVGGLVRTVWPWRSLFQPPG